MTDTTVAKKETVALKPCPFCGSIPYMDDWTHSIDNSMEFYGCAVGCIECGFEFRGSGTGDDT